MIIITISALEELSVLETVVELETIKEFGDFSSRAFFTIGILPPVSPILKIYGKIDGAAERAQSWDLFLVHTFEDKFYYTLLSISRQNVWTQI